MELMNLMLQYELYIIDMDGTLYYQSKLRGKLIAIMLKELFTNRHFLGELYVVYKFRRLREELAGKTYDDVGLYKRVSEESPKSLKLSAEKVAAIINKWIYEMPLPILYDCRDDKLIRFIKAATDTGKLVYIYSDYPVEAKAKALGIDCEKVICLDASNANVNAYKASPAGIDYILKESKVAASLAVMIGDRDSRDGAAARNAGIDALILDRKKSKRYRNA